MNPRIALLVAICLIPVVACGPIEGAPATAAEQQQQDIDQFNEVTEELNENRTEEFSSSAMYPRAVENHFFWLQFAGIAPTIHSHDYSTDTRTNYQFSIGEGDDFNFEASTELIATAEPSGNDVIYSAYATNSAEELLGTLVLDAPQTEAKWWDYQAVGDKVYIVQEIDDEHWLRMWDPSSAAEPESLFSLESASGSTVGEFWTFAIHGDTLIYVESGRVWKGNLSTEQATWTENQQQVMAGAFNDEIAIYDQSEGLVLFTFHSGETTNLSEPIIESYSINETFTSSHHYNGNDFFLWEDQLIYTGNRGVFAYGIYTGELTPILLEPRPEITGGDRIVYRYPVVLESGLLFVTGLTSSSGSVGAQGPTYKVDLKVLGL